MALPADLPPLDVDEGHAEECRRSFAAFVRRAWPLAGTTEPLIWGWHLDALCSHIQAVEEGQIRRLLINIAPGMGKSKLVSVLYPAWSWTRTPTRQFLCASYAYDLAERDSVYCRQLVESEWYTRLFMHGNWRLKPDQNTKSFWSNTVEGHRISTGVGGTGKRADRIVIDDPLSAVDAHSKAARETTTGWIGQTLVTRFNDQATSGMVMIMQRLHEEDPSAFVMAGGDWEHLCLPSEFEPDRRCVTYRSVKVPANGTPEHVEREEFWRDPRTVSGELLFPEKFPQSVLDDAKRPNALGAYGFAGQHQQRPSPAGGGMFRAEDWRFWKPDGTAANVCPRPAGCYDGPARPLPELDSVIISVDANFKAKATADPVAMLVIGSSGADRFILDRRWGPFGFARSVSILRDLVAAWPAVSKVLVEDAANGSAIIESLQREIVGIVAVKPEGGKESRAWAVQAQVEAGQCYLPDGAPWLGEFIEEFSAFPKGRHDDQVDAWSQGLLELRHPLGVLDAWARVTG